MRKNKKRGKIIIPYLFDFISESLKIGNSNKISVILSCIYTIHWQLLNVFFSHYIKFVIYVVPIIVVIRYNGYDIVVVELIALKEECIDKIKDKEFLIFQREEEIKTLQEEKSKAKEELKLVGIRIKDITLNLTNQWQKIKN